MKFGAVPLDKASNKILGHKTLAPDGKKLFTKGHTLTEADMETLRIASVVVADPAPTNLDANEAARRVGIALAGENVRVTAPDVGRAKLTATVTSPPGINVTVLNHLNNIDEGIILAILREHTLVQKDQLLALGLSPMEYWSRGLKMSK